MCDKAMANLDLWKAAFDYPGITGKAKWSSRGTFRHQKKFEIADLE